MTQGCAGPNAEFITPSGRKALGGVGFVPANERVHLGNAGGRFCGHFATRAMDNFDKSFRR